MFPEQHVCCVSRCYSKSNIYRWENEEFKFTDSPVAHALTSSNLRLTRQFGSYLILCGPPRKGVYTSWVHLCHHYVNEGAKAGMRLL